MAVLVGADERYDRKYRLKSLGYDISRVERKVIKLYNIEEGGLYPGSREKPISEVKGSNGYDDMDVASQRNTSIQDKSGSEGGIDPLNIANPAGAYFFMSDDAQDEIGGGKRKNMKCRSCGHRFAGEFFECCPECHGVNTEEMVDE